VRIVLDTNVLLSALVRPGVCKLVLDACLLRKKHNVVLSEHILREFARVAQVKFEVPGSEVRNTVGFLRRVTELVEPADVPPGACRDPDDLPVLGTALAGRADCLVTGDADLLALGEYRGIPILTPRGFYERPR
jgi:hypothetical protein